MGQHGSKRRRQQQQNLLVSERQPHLPHTALTPPPYPWPHVPGGDTARWMADSKGLVHHAPASHFFAYLSRTSVEQRWSLALDLAMRVIRVAPDSPASKAGVAEGDLVTAVMDTELKRLCTCAIQEHMCKSLQVTLCLQRDLAHHHPFRVRLTKSASHEMFGVSIECPLSCDHYGPGCKTPARVRDLSEAAATCGIQVDDYIVAVDNNRNMQFEQMTAYLGRSQTVELLVHRPFYYSTVLPLVDCDVCFRDGAVEIRSVVPHSAAEQAGLRGGDRVVGITGQLGDCAALIFMKMKQKTEPVKLILLRGVQD